MPRPSQPLIDRDRVIDTALKIIDAEGLAACSLPRLSRELGVKAPSLYHHFADRAEIMSEVARHIVLETVANPWTTPERLFAESIRAFLRGTISGMSSDNSATVVATSSAEPR